MSVGESLLRAIPFVVGNVLVAIGAFMIFPVWGGLLAAMWLAFGLLILRARLTNRAQTGERWTVEENLRATWEFRAKTIVSTSFTFVFMAWVIWVLISIRGSADIGFVVAGTALTAIDYLLIEPLWLTKVGRRHGLDSADVGADEVTLRKALAKQLRGWSVLKKLFAVCAAAVCVFLAYELSRQRDVPDLSGLDVATATTKLADHDLEIEVVGGQRGLVCHQQPKPGNGDAHEGDVVQVFLCAP